MYDYIYNGNETSQLISSGTTIGFVFFMIIICLTIILPTILIINTFIMFYRIKKITKLLEEQNENIEALINIENQRNRQNLNQ